MGRRCSPLAGQASGTRGPDGMGRRMRRRVGATWRAAAGQGTVEYVGLILLVAVILAGVIAATRHAAGGADIAGLIVKQIQRAIETVR